MKVAVNKTTKKIVDVLPDSASNSNRFIVDNNYLLMDIESPYELVDSHPVFRALSEEELDYLYENTIEERLLEINTQYESSVESLVDNTPKSERETWIKQETEARAWLLDNSAYTPVINGIMIGREIEKEWLVNKIIEKADLYAENIGVLMGVRQKKEKEILGD